MKLLILHAWPEIIHHYSLFSIFVRDRPNRTKIQRISEIGYTNAPYLLAIDLIHSVATVVAAIDRVRSDSTNQMQENILFLCI